MTAAMKATATTAYHDSLPGGRLARRATTGACQSSRLSLDELVVGLNPAVGVEYYELESDASDLTAACDHLPPELDDIAEPLAIVPRPE
jgi:hypothetical protein